MDPNDRTLIVVAIASIGAFFGIIGVAVLRETHMLTQIQCDVACISVLLAWFAACAVSVVRNYAQTRDR